MTLLAELNLFSVDIPFRRAFRHAAAARSATQSVWVEARSADGEVGYGEACPRSYVTGEDVASVQAFLRRYRGELCATIGGLSDLVAWGDAQRDTIDRNPAGWCAIELALLDLLAKRERRSVESLLGLPEPRGSFHYSAVVGIESDDDFRRLVEAYVTAGFNDFKLKLSGDLMHDRAQLAWFQQRVPPGWRLRLDANNLWASASDAVRYLEALSCPFFAVEEPLGWRSGCAKSTIASHRSNHWLELARLGTLMPAAIILDETCTRAADLCDADPAGRWIVNVRVSKMGGLLRSLAVVDAAVRRRMPVIVGAQVGETSLLSRAALTVAAQAGDSLLAQEGAFGTLLLAADPCEPPLIFGHGGVLTAPAPGPGFGLTIRHGALDEVLQHQDTKTQRQQR